MDCEIGDYVVNNDKYIRRMIRMYKLKLEDMQQYIYRMESYDQETDFITVTLKGKLYIFKADEMRKATELEIKKQKIKEIFIK